MKRVFASIGFGVLLLGCAPSAQDEAAARAEITVASAELVDLLGLESPTVMVYGRLCPPRDDRLGPCDELGVTVGWDLETPLESELCEIVSGVAEQLESTGAAILVGTEPCLVEMCFRGLPGVVGGAPPAHLQILLGYDPSRC